MDQLVPGQLFCRAARLALPALALAACVACGGAAAAERSDRDRGLSDAPVRGDIEIEPVVGDLAAGVRNFKDGELEDAETALNRHLKVNPKSALAWYHLGLIAMERKAFDPARKDFEKALALNPQIHGASSNLGVLYLEAGEDIAALRVLTDARVLAPKDPRVLANLATAQLRRGLWSQAIDTFKEAVELAPGHASLLYDYAAALMDRFEYEAALKLLDEALMYRPGFALAKAARVACLQGLGHVDEAIAYAEQALKDLPEPVVENYIVLGRALVAGGATDDGLDALQKAVKLKPDSAAAQLALGELLDAAGKKREAMGFYTQFLKNPARSAADARRIRDRQKQLQTTATP